MLSLFMLMAAVVLTSCGGGGGGNTTPTCPPCSSAETPFWAADFTTYSYYCVCAAEVSTGATGTYSRIFVEHGRTLPLVLEGLQNEFDDKIYPMATANFGSEPNPGIDGDPKITILLLNIRDGFNGAGGYVAGYFDPGNEYPLSANPFSNQREMFYLNINPILTDTGAVTANDFYTTLAHEFQHMIHWEQKSRLLNKDDDTWLDEAMSEAAPTYLYGPSCSRLYEYEKDPSNSLTIWNDSIYDYSIAYMWSQYYKDQFGGTIFKEIMQQNSIGITSVNSALTATGSTRTFASTFYDMSIAIGSGMTTTTWWTGYPEWTFSVASGIETWPNTCESYSIPGIFQTAPLNPDTVSALDPWSIRFSTYAPLSPPTGSVKWTEASSTQKAALIDSGADILYTNLASAETYSYTTNGLLIVSNPSDVSLGSGGTVVR
ncbi:MAG: hypothetical protein HGB35_09510, partial [Geobacteraceae bacterium]|nr:hypothetical protein [Geobacteraceae bacterium]